MKFAKITCALLLSASFSPVVCSFGVRGDELASKEFSRAEVLEMEVTGFLNGGDRGFFMTRFPITAEYNSPFLEIAPRNRPKSEEHLSNDELIPFVNRCVTIRGLIKGMSGRGDNVVPYMPAVLSATLADPCICAGPPGIVEK